MAWITTSCSPSSPTNRAASRTPSPGSCPANWKRRKAGFFPDAATAAAFASQLIATRQYRVDVGIGQINNEAHIQPKGWTLAEILDPQRGLERTAEVLRERGWSGYHSNESGNAVIWQGAALKTLRYFYPKATLRRPNEPASLVDRSGSGATVPSAPAFVITPDAVVASNKPPAPPATLDPNQPVSVTPSNEADKAAAPDASEGAPHTETAAAPATVFQAQSWFYQAQSEEDGEVDEEQPVIIFGAQTAATR